MKRIIKAGIFKAKCLKIMDEVKQSKQSILITKHNVPIVKLVPVEDKNQKEPIFGKMKNTLHIKGDLIKPIEEHWDADT